MLRIGIERARIFRLLRPQVAQQHAGAARCKRASSCRPDAVIRAGDKGHVAGEIEWR